MTTLRKTLFSVRAGSSSSSADRGKEISPQHVGSIPEDDFRGKGVELNVKYFGRCEVSEPRGERVAHAAMKELKQQLQASSGHKQRVVVNLSMFGVQLFDEKRLKELAKHSVKAISFMTIDPDDTKTFSYIAAEGPDEQNPKRIFRLYCFKSEKQTVLITKSMMRIFKLAHEEKKKQQSGDEGGKPIVRRGTTRNSDSGSQSSQSSDPSILSPTSPAKPRMDSGRKRMLASAPNLHAANRLSSSSDTNSKSESPSLRSSGKSTTSADQQQHRPRTTAMSSPPTAIARPGKAELRPRLSALSSSRSRPKESGLGMTLQELSASAYDVRGDEGLSAATDVERPQSCDMRDAELSGSTRGRPRSQTFSVSVIARKPSSQSPSDLLSVSPIKERQANTQSVLLPAPLQPTPFFPLNTTLSSPEAEIPASRQDTGSNDLLNPCDLFGTPKMVNLLGDIPLPSSPTSSDWQSYHAVNSTSSLASSDWQSHRAVHSTSSTGTNLTSPIFGSCKPRARPTALAHRLLSPTSSNAVSTPSSAAGTPVSQAESPMGRAIDSPSSTHSAPWPTNWTRFDDTPVSSSVSGSMLPMDVKPLPPLPTPAQGNESQYASLSSNVSPTPAKLQQGGRGSLALIELNNAEAAAVAAAQNANLASGEPPNSNYAAVNPGLKATFSMVPFGLPLSRVDDVTAMPAPIGAPYVDVAPDPFSDMEQPGAPPHPVQARGSTIMAFDPVGFGGEKGTAAPDGFGSDFGGFSDSFTPQSAEEQPGSDVYAVPRFPPIRAVLSDEDDPARDSGSLFPSTTPTS